MATIDGHSVSQMDRTRLRAEIKSRVCRRIMQQSSFGGVEISHVILDEVDREDGTVQITVHVDQMGAIPDEFSEQIEQKFAPLVTVGFATGSWKPGVVFTCYLDMLEDEPKLSPYR